MLKRFKVGAGSWFGCVSTFMVSFFILVLPAYSATVPLSDGSDGIFHPSQSINLDLVPDAVFNFSTITIEPTVSVGFNRNGSDTPIYFLATGDILIDGTLDGGNGPLYLSTSGIITLGGNLLGQELTLSGNQIVINGSATMNGSTVNFLAPGATNPVTPPTSGGITLNGGGSVRLVPVPIPPSGGLLAWGLGTMWIPRLIRRRRRATGVFAIKGNSCPGFPERGSVCA